MYIDLENFLIRAEYVAKDGFIGEKFELGWDKGAKEVILHELQHAIQKIEGFATGTNTRDKNYDRSAGEIEAFDTGRRANLTAEQRKNTRPGVVVNLTNNKYYCLTGQALNLT